MKSKCACCRDDDGVSAELVAAGLEVRMCPRCGTRIEKNQGCDTMDCCELAEHCCTRLLP